MLKMNMTTQEFQYRLAKHVAFLRIVFGGIWVIDAALKWQPSFASGFLGYIKDAADGQPAWLSPWFDFWNHVFGANPQLFANLTMISESLIALALVLGLARRVTYLSAAVFSLLVWSIAEGFGGPYTSASTDIGTGIIYAIVFLALYGLERLATPARLAVDNYIVAKLPWWSVIANP